MNLDRGIIAGANKMIARGATKADVIVYVMRRTMCPNRDVARQAVEQAGFRFSEGGTSFYTGKPKKVRLGRPELRHQAPRAARPETAFVAAVPPNGTVIHGPVKRIEDLHRSHCRWPIGDVGDPGFYFCGQNRRDGSSYCADHEYVAFRRLID